MLLDSSDQLFFFTWNKHNNLPDNLHNQFLQKIKSLGVDTSTEGIEFKLRRRRK